MDGLDHERLSFASLEERDAWMSREHPGRECSDVPGFYDLPGGGHLGVRELDVIVYPPRVES